jgi:hypothetical protein
MKTAKPTQKPISKATAPKEVAVDEVITDEVVVVTESHDEAVEPKVEIVKSEPVKEVSNESKVELRDIVRIIRKSPHVTEVLLSSGDTVQISTEDFEKLRNPEDPTNTIQYL